MKPSFMINLKPEHYDALIQLRNHLKISRKSERTITSYVSCVRKLILEYNKLPEECTKAEIISFVVKQEENNQYKYATIKLIVYSIKYYLTHVAENNDLSLKVPCPSRKNYDLEVLTTQEIVLLMSVCTDSRQRLLIEMLYETGMRLQELANLRLRNIDLNLNCLSIIKSKNNKTRTISFGNKLKESIENYLNDYPTLFDSNLFTKKYDPFINLSAKGIYWNLKYIAAKTKINKRISPHVLRHTFAVHYLDFGGSLYQLQKLLGHDLIATTLNYLQYAIVPEGLTVSPLDKLMEVISKDNNSKPF